MQETTSNKLSKIVARIIGAKDSSAKSAMRRLPEGDLRHQKKQENHDTVIGYLHSMKFKMRPLKDITFSDDELD